MTQFNSDHTSGKHRSGRLAGYLLLLVVLLLDLLFMPRTFWRSDAIQWRQESRSILLHGWLRIDPDVALAQVQPGGYFVFNPSDGQWYSKYGILNSLMALPPMALERLITGTVPQAGNPNVLISNLWNILLSLLLAAVLYVISGRYTAGPALRAAFVLACLFSTCLWYYQRAQGAEIYQALFFAVLYESLLRSLGRSGQPRTGWMLMTWLAAGLLVLTRVFFGIFLVLLIAIYCAVLIARAANVRRALAAVFIPPFLILALLGWINNTKFGSPYLTGYEQAKPESSGLTGSWLEGVYGLLFSGHWSIFLYFPLLFPALAGLRRFWIAHRLDAWVILSMFLPVLLVLAKIPTWRGEWTYGPRYMLFILPILSLPCICFAEGLIARAGSLSGAAFIALTVCALGFCVWMQVEVIRADFWFWYTIEMPVNGRMDTYLAEYLYDRHESMIYYDLQSHRHDLGETVLFRDIDRNHRMTTKEYADYLDVVAKALDDSSFYWWPPKPTEPSPEPSRISSH